MKHLSLLVVAVLMGITAMAQGPSKFNYQAVARDASGVLISDGTVGVKVSILTGSATGTEVYSETHSAATNVYGMMNFQIGAGSGATGDISTITWGSDAHFIKVEMDPAGGSSYTVSNTSELISVPYAEYANSALHVDDADADSTNEVQMIMMAGDTLMLSMDGGSIDMSGYDQSAGVAANDSAIGVNTTAIATNATALAAHITADADVDSTNELITDMMLDGDTMLQITEDGAVHEVDLTALVNDNDWVRSDDTLSNTADSLISIGATTPWNAEYKLNIDPGLNLGGIAQYMYYSNSNDWLMYNYDYYHNGYNYGIYNYFYDGSSGGYGLYNHFYYNNSTVYGTRNNIYYNTSTSYGTYNYLLGSSSQSGSMYANYNSASGYGAYNYGSYNNVYNYRSSGTGYAYGAYNNARKYNGSYGRSYGAYNYSYNTSTYGQTYGAYNYAYAAGSNDYAYGSYNYAYGGNYTNYSVYSVGNSYASGYWSSSDRKLKKNIRDYQGAMSDIMKLQPRIYDFDTEEYPTMGLPEQEQFGLIAQELEEVFPNLVQAAHNPAVPMTEEDAKERGLEYRIMSEAEFDEEGNEVTPTMVEAGEEVDFKAVNIDGLIPVLIKGIQEQQEIISANEAMIEELKARIETLENN
ncbi:MAG: tail fiber domain-containing protein [Flavobacteriales bacterium]|nr:tail fiber domain-containing protein [Flavobacteriales bacterium]